MVFVAMPLMRTVARMLLPSTKQLTTHARSAVLSPTHWMNVVEFATDAELCLYVGHVRLRFKCWTISSILFVRRPDLMPAMQTR